MNNLKRGGLLEEMEVDLHDLAVDIQGDKTVFKNIEIRAPFGTATVSYEVQGTQGGLDDGPSGFGVLGNLRRGAFSPTATGHSYLDGDLLLLPVQIQIGLEGFLVGKFFDAELKSFAVRGVLRRYCDAQDIVIGGKYGEQQDDCGGGKSDDGQWGE